MKLCLLHLDDALSSQTDFIGHCERNGASHLYAEALGSTVRLWGRNGELEQLEALIRGKSASMGTDAKLWFLGSGDFHHVSALLIDRAVQETGEPLTVIHFDNHPDWVHFQGGMHCGSWVNRAAANPLVAKIITVGVTSNDLNRPERKGGNLSLLADGTLELFPFWHKPSRVGHHYGEGAGHRSTDGEIQWNTVAEQGEEAFLALLLTRVQTPNIYLTIDKDVLRGEDATTNWDQGQMRLPYLLTIIAALGKEFRIVGADVTGDYSTPRYSGRLFTRLRKYGEIFLDQPCRPCPTQAARINSASNHALLDMLQQAMA